ncbi:hypothetical protein TrVE_jg13315 [Triparma verrucosa]|uniref:Choline/carnitine acyltransferase domain-containing protein n=1 Tax=Triparma verrucosa TaxID=1606542 RepID=A0A9W7F9T3_9STRA|nr:hypothetical protein TrVE_jg13315 [Triparma verrucosa]
MTSKRSSMTSKTSTYTYQSDLPKLPVPALADTLEKYLSFVKPIQSPEAHKATCEAVAKFRSEGGEGEKLQELLQEYSEDKASYVEEFWSDAYLVPDTSPVLNLNPFFLLEDGPDQKTSKSQVGRAASLTFASLKFASLLYTETLHPDVVRGKPLCMAQFKHIFGSARIPHTKSSAERDEVLSDPNSKHVVVMCRGQLYYFQALREDGSVVCNEMDIRGILEAVLSDSEKLKEEERALKAVGVLTSLDRSRWAHVRENLISHSAHNKAALEIIDSALFVLVLDDYIPKDIHEAAANFLHGSYELRTDDGDEIDYQAGTCINRWYDKLQLIVCTDGSAGVNFEHSAIDGHTALRFVSDIFADTVVTFAQSITKTIYSKDHIPSHLNAKVNADPTIDTRPKKLNFDIPSASLEHIHYAETLLGDQILASHTHILEFRDFGKTFITGNKMSPDSFVQMSIILAYYRLYGEFVCAYEPVLTKFFLHGRTEAMRSATPKAKLFCECWCSSFPTRQEKIQHLMDAVSEHASLVKECAGGKGVDRHLFSLKSIASKNNVPVPDFFNDAGYKALNHTYLSTSNCGNPSLRLFGFGPVVADGFGIGYIIRDHGLQYTVTSKHRQTERFVNTLARYLKEVQDFCGGTTKIAVRNYRQTSAEKMDVEGLESFDSQNSVSPRNKTKVAQDMMYSEAFDDIYGESTNAGMMDKVKRRPSVDAKTFKEVGVDIDEALMAAGTISPNSNKRKLGGTE